MPVVTRKTGLDVQTAALPQARLTAARTGISEGAEVERANQERAGAWAEIGEKVTRIGTQMYAQQQEDRRREQREARQQADELAIVDAKNQINDWKKERVYDPEKGALAIRGKDSFELPEQLDAEFEKVSGEIGKKMATPEQKLAYEKLLVGEREQLQLETRRHVNAEFKTYAAGQLSSTVTNGIDDAVRANTTPNYDGQLDVHRGFQAMEVTIGDLKRMAPQLGMSPQQVEEQERAIRTKVHEDTIKVLADQKPAAARAYWTEVKNEVNADRRDDIEKTLHAGTTKKEAQTATDKIVGEGGTLDQQLAKAKAIDDPDVRDEVESRIEHAHAVKEKVKRDTIEAQDVEIANVLDKTRNVASIPASTWSKLSSQERNHWRDYTKDLITKGEPETDIKTYYSLLQQAQNDPQKFKDVNLTAPGTLSKLSKSDLKHLADVQGAIRAGDTKRANEGLSGFMTNSQIVNQMFLGAGMDTTPKPGTKEAEAYTTMLAAVDQQVAAWKSTHPGKEPNSEDVRRIADDLLKEAVTEKGTGLWRDVFTARPYADTVKRIGAVTLADMPAELRKQAEDWQRANGRQVSEEQTLVMYRRWLIDQSKKAPK